jgi:1,4-dihydroxy-6-naphthoate synthase
MSHPDIPQSVVLTLAHSPDPDDAFMWWPLTGKIEPPAALQGDAQTRVLEPPILDTGRFRFGALAADIEVLNRRALQRGDLDITALSVRTWADGGVRDRYAITACGASFGDGFGPRLVTRATDSNILCERCLSKPVGGGGVTVAIPGKGTTAFLMLGLLLKELRDRGIDGGGWGGGWGVEPRFLEMPFDQIIPAVMSARADVGLVIHEGQLSFGDSGLCMVMDVGAWWKQRTGLKLPLGINAVRRDLDSRYGPGSLAEVSSLLRRSVRAAMERWDESVAYTMAFAQANLRRPGTGGMGGGEASLERVERYCRMYVTSETLDMGDEGREAIRRLLAEGAAAGLCPAVGEIDIV